MTKAGRNPAKSWAPGVVLAVIGLIVANASLVLGLVLVMAGALLLAMGRGYLNAGSVVIRPVSEATAYPAPPPPDTIMVKCEFCGTVQPFKEKCVECGAPLPKP